MLSPRQREALAIVADGRFYPALVEEDDGWHARWRPLGGAGDAVAGWVDEYVREANVTRLTEDAEEDRHETLHDAWMMALKSRTGLVVWDAGECAEFAAELAAWSGSAEEDVEARRSIVFAFAASGDAGDPSFAVSCGVPKGQRRLKALGQAVCVWSPLSGLRMRRDGGGDPRLAVSLSQPEAEDFLRRGVRELRDAGYAVEGAELSAEIAAAAEIGSEAETEPAAPPAIRLTVRIAGEDVSAAEIRFLLDQGSSLVWFRDHWIEIDRNLLKEALKALEKGAGKRANALAFALGIGHVGALAVETVKAHGWLRGLVNELRAAGRLEAWNGDSVRLGLPGLRGELRDYQRRGADWLWFMTEHGFGALLADDMGLGKTVQVIAWMLRHKADLARRGTSRPAVLVVAPLTLLGNWKHELAKFAPSLKMYVHQGSSRHVAGGFRMAAAEADVTLTSYNLLVRDYAEFAETQWTALALDEAQAIKNPDTQVARAVRALSPPRRIAMTGTPVENSVEDVWALEDFLNPGLLGDRKPFAERFARPLAADPFCRAGKRLHRALEPFVLRRVKSDPRIAAELGEKRELREYCELTDRQRRAYEAELSAFRARERAPGDVFALLTRLKLVCDGEGKLLRLLDLLETVFAAGESALVFTQYAKVGKWLADEMAKRFGRQFPLLHGGLSAAAREREIARFNRRGPSAFVLSLKAGGYGLNLTKATHVIHFDRWWNPAVENQATDRAHRIGQRRQVWVHLFIAAGTLEEHVDELLARKSRIAGAVVTEAEWLEAVKLDG